MKKILAGLLIGALIASSTYAYNQPEVSGDLDAAGSGWELTFENCISSACCNIDSYVHPFSPAFRLHKIIT